MEGIEIQMNSEPLGITLPRVPDYAIIPKKPVNVALVLGMGPLIPQFVGEDRKRHPAIGSPWMRHNSLATKELATHGLIKDYIITCGGGAGDKAMDEQLAREPRNFRETHGRPQDEKEEKRIREATDAEIAAWLIERAPSRPGVADRKEVVPTILIEPSSENTIQNMVRAINMLDSKWQQKYGKIFDGTIAVVTSEFGHVARAKEILNALGFPDDQVVPVTAQEVLRSSGYSGRLYKDFWHGKPYEQQMNDTKANQERWRRGVREKIAYFISEIQYFENDERLLKAASTARNWFGDEALINLGLAVYGEQKEVQLLPVNNLRERLRVLGEQRKNKFPDHPQWWPPEQWNPGDLAKQKEEIKQYSQITSQWIKDTKPL